MYKKKKKPVNFDVMVKFFIKHYGIPTKKDIEKVLVRMDRLEKLIKKMAKPSQTPKSETGKEKGSENNDRETASDKVLDVVKNSKDGITFADIKRITGFEEKKLRNVIFRLNKTGRIQRKGRGLYIIKDGE